MKRVNPGKTHITKTHQRDNLNSTLSILRAELVVKNLPLKKLPSQDGFTGEFQQTLKKKKLVKHKLFQKIEETLPNSFFYEVVLP